jgi:hypothetical protein
MKRSELIELHYITPIVNISSILRLGILSHNRAKRVEHTSVAMSEIQDRRARVTVPRGKRLHDYVNLYVCARNPMLYKRQAQFKELCILIVSPNVLDLPGVVISDRNASSEYAIFKPAPDGLGIVNREWTFAEYWTDSDQIREWKKKAAKCAEVLVPDEVKPHFISGAYVSCQEAMAAFQAQEPGVSAVVNSHLFFG